MLKLVLVHMQWITKCSSKYRNVAQFAMFNHTGFAFSAYIHERCLIQQPNTAFKIQNPMELGNDHNVTRFQIVWIPHTHTHTYIRIQTAYFKVSCSNFAPFIYDWNVPDWTHRHTFAMGIHQPNCHRFLTTWKSAKGRCSWTVVTEARSIHANWVFVEFNTGNSTTVLYQHTTNPKFNSPNEIQKSSNIYSSNRFEPNYLTNTKLYS